MKLSNRVKTGGLFAILMLVMVPATRLHAELDNDGFVQAYGKAQLFRLLFRECQKLDLKPDEDEYRQWAQRNKIEQLDLYFEHAFGNSRLLAEKRGAMDQTIAEAASTMVPNACYGLDQVAKMPDLNPLQAFPELVAEVDSISRAAAPRPPMQLNSSGKFDVKHVKSVTESIATLAFDNLRFRGQYNALPVLLFKDGTGCMDLRLLVEYNSVEKHRQDHPDYWFKWRRQGGTLERQTGNGWKKIAYQNSFPIFPADFRLNRSYRRTDGSGWGDNASVSIDNFQFFKNGHFTDSRILSARTGNSLSGASGNFLSKSPQYSGQYYIEGLVLRLEYADGSVTHYGIATDDLQHPGVIWLDGLYYVSF